MAVSEHESSSSSASARQNADRNSRSASSNNAGACYLAKTVLRGSVVLQAVRGHFRSPASYDVVFGKETSIELAIIDEDGVMQSITEQPVFGTKILQFFLGMRDFKHRVQRFFPLTHLQLSAPGNPRHEVGRMLTVDSRLFNALPYTVVALLLPVRMRTSWLFSRFHFPPVVKSLIRESLVLLKKMDFCKLIEDLLISLESS